VLGDYLRDASGLRASTGFLWLLTGMILARLGWSDSDRWAWVRGVLTLVRGSCILGLSSRANVSNDRNEK
jgi:hypothetical protein